MLIITVGSPIFRQVVKIGVRSRHGRDTHHYHRARGRSSTPAHPPHPHECAPVVGLLFSSARQLAGPSRRLGRHRLARPSPLPRRPPLESCPTLGRPALEHPASLASSSYRATRPHRRPPCQCVAHAQRRCCLGRLRTCPHAHHLARL